MVVEQLTEITEHETKALDHNVHLKVDFRSK